MIADFLTQKGVQRTLQNHFTPEVNRKASFSSALNGDILEMTMVYEGSDYNCSYPTKGTFNGKRITPSSSIERGKVHFYEVLKDIADRKKAVEAEKEAIRAEAMAEVKTETKPEVKDIDSLTAEELAAIKLRTEEGEKVTDIAKELGVQWQSLKAKIK